MSIFAGVRIVELAQYVFVPGGTVLLADQGAEVIKIEPPGSGDPYRSLMVGDGREVGATNLAMEQNNRSKKSLALDLKSAEGRQALLDVIGTADVFVTSLRPKAMRKLGLGIDDLRAINPKLIYVRGNGYGFKGEDADKAGFDASAHWARGGLAYAFTRPGQEQLTSPRAAFGDHSGSVSLAFGIAGALYKRAMTGEPSVVETSLLGTAVWQLSSDVTYSQATGYHPFQSGVSPLMHNYKTRDGRYLLLMLLNPQPFWPGLCRMLDIVDLVDDPRFHDNAARRANAQVLIDIIQDRIGARDWIEWKPMFDAWDAPWELVRTIAEIAEDPQVHANGMLIHSRAPGGEPLRLVAGPVAFDGETIDGAPRSSPALGEHTDELLRSAGYDDAAITRLKSAGAAG